MSGRRKIRPAAENTGRNKLHMVCTADKLWCRQILLGWRPAHEVSCYLLTKGASAWNNKHKMIQARYQTSVLVLEKWIKSIYNCPISWLPDPHVYQIFDHTVRCWAEVGRNGSSQLTDCVAMNRQPAIILTPLPLFRVIQGKFKDVNSY